MSYSSKLFYEKNPNFRIIETNKFSHMQEENFFFYTTTDVFYRKMKEVEKKDVNVVLIIGNGDEPFYHGKVDFLPKNVKYVYTINNLSSDEKVFSIPYGIGNFTSDKFGDSPWFNYNEVKLECLKHLPNISPKHFIYSNFTLGTNKDFRKNCMLISQDTEYITWEEPTLAFDKLYIEYLNHEMILCPPGNGLDTHRVWETLYCGRVPIVIKVKNTRSYDFDSLSHGLFRLYDKLPIVLLNSIEELKNFSLLEKKLSEANTKWDNCYLLDYYYWEKQIQDKIKEIKEM
jgi:hypothetical protein